MDPYASGGIGAAIVAAAGLVYHAVNHKRVRSRCCGRSLEASLDIDQTVPTPPTAAQTAVVVAPPELVIRQPAVPPEK